MTRRTTWLATDRVVVTFTSPLEWSRTCPGELWSFGFWRSRRYGIVHVRVMGVEVGVYR